MNLNLIPSTPIPVDYIGKVQPRIPGSKEVVIINNAHELIMPEPSRKEEICWLAEQALFNPKCRQNQVNDIEIAYLLKSPVSYDQAVNM